MLISTELCGNWAGKASALCAVLVFSLSGGALLAHEPYKDGGQPPTGCGKARALAQRHLAEQARGQWREEYESMVAAGLREAMEDTDLLHCDLEIEILPDEYDNMDGANTMTIQSKSSALTQFTFRLHEQYSIDSAVVNSSTPVTVENLSTTTWVVTLDQTYGLDEVFTLTIEYSGHAASDGFGSIEFASHSGWDIVYTLSEPYYSYTWWPIKDGDYAEPGDNSDKFTLELAIIAPQEMVTASNGTLQGIDSLLGNRERYRWSSDYPITTYLVCFSSTNYDTWTQTYLPLAGGSMPVDFYIYPEHNTPEHRAAWNVVVDVLYTLRDLYGEYPFVDEKYGIYECEFGGGMEHQTFTAQGSFSEWLTVHELGHQWWGDMVTCKTWNHIWLNEGFATYTEALWQEFKPGSSGLPALKSVMAGKKYTGEGSVYVTDAECGSLYDIFAGSTSYKKGAWVLHMLRHVLGSDSFFDALAAYRAAYEDGAATTEDFQVICEQFYPSGDLEWFFQEWIYGEWAPAYSWGWDDVLVNGQRYLLVYIDQTQLASYQRFTMPIDIVGDAQTYVVFNDADPEHFVIPIDSAPVSVELDPDEWILWSSRSSTSYVPGPPKIVEASPAPGEVVVCGPDADTVAVTFHTDVSTSAGHYSLVGDSTGAVAVGFAYDSGTNTVTLTAPAALAPDDYTLTVDDALTAVDSGQQLDGEMADPMDAASLPSGDGVAGGSAVLSFTVVYGAGDSDCSGTVDLADFARFQECFTGPDGGPAAWGCQMMTFDADDDVDLTDFVDFQAQMLGP